MNTGSIPQTADEWVVALSDNPGDAQLRRRHSQWLEQNAGNRKDWNQSLRTWQMLGMTVPAHIDAWGRQPRPKPWRRTAAGAAIALLAACLILLLTPAALLHLRADYATASGEIRSFSLPDGSRMTLAPDSAAALAFSASARHVELFEGQAFFDVAEAAGRPFRVQAGAVDIVVTGTAFDVQHSASGIDVSVEHGQVRVEYRPQSQPAHAHDLRAGDRLHIGRDGRQQLQPVSPALIAGWRNGQLFAADQPVRDAVAILNRYFDGWIIVADDSLGRQPLTGVYTLSDPKAAVRAIAEVQGAKVRELSPWLLILSAN